MCLSSAAVFKPYTTEEVSAAMNMYQVTECHAKRLLERAVNGPFGRKANLKRLEDLQAATPSEEELAAAVAAKVLNRRSCLSRA